MAKSPQQIQSERDTVGRLRVMAVVGLIAGVGVMFTSPATDMVHALYPALLLITSLALWGEAHRRSLKLPKEEPPPIDDWPADDWPAKPQP